METATEVVSSPAAAAVSGAPSKNLMNILSLISEEEGGADSCSVVCTYPNSTETIFLHRWHQHGKKRVKAEDGQHYEKLYYKCAVASCKARYTAHLVAPHRKLLQCKEDHCHEMESKKKKQDSGDPLQNVIGKYGRTFVHSLSIYPILSAHCFEQASINMLCEAHTIGICTSGVGQSSLMLTTFLISVHNFGIPVAWLLHSSKEPSPFKKFIKAVQKTAYNRFHPKLAVLEFEDKSAESLQESLTSILPHLVIQEDHQHFEQANVRWMNDHGFKDRIHDLLQDLRRLWNTEQSTRNLEVEAFLRRWQYIPSFVAYFRKKWVEEVSTELWGRLDTQSPIPPGILEEYRNRVRTHVLAGLPKKATLDRVVDALHEEMQHWQRVVGSDYTKSSITKIITSS